MRGRKPTGSLLPNTSKEEEIDNPRMRGRKLINRIHYILLLTKKLIIPG